jgi:ABC-type phosphonate transport system ATPase subunit
MREYTACLNVSFQARDEDEAREIIRTLAIAVRCTEFKVEVEVDDMEMA